MNHSQSTEYSSRRTSMKALPYSEAQLSAIQSCCFQRLLEIIAAVKDKSQIKGIAKHQSRVMPGRKYKTLKTKINKLVKLSKDQRYGTFIDIPMIGNPIISALEGQLKYRCPRNTTDIQPTAFSVSELFEDFPRTKSQRSQSDDQTDFVSYSQSQCYSDNTTTDVSTESICLGFNPPLHAESTDDINMFQKIKQDQYMISGGNLQAYTGADFNDMLYNPFNYEVPLFANSDNYTGTSMENQPFGFSRDQNPSNYLD